MPQPKIGLSTQSSPRYPILILALDGMHVHLHQKFADHLEVIPGHACWNHESSCMRQHHVACPAGMRSAAWLYCLSYCLMDALRGCLDLVVSTDGSKQLACPLQVQPAAGTSQHHQV